MVAIATASPAYALTQAVLDLRKLPVSRLMGIEKRSADHLGALGGAVDLALLGGALGREELNRRTIRQRPDLYGRLTNFPRGKAGSFQALEPIWSGDTLIVRLAPSPRRLDDRTAAAED